MLQVLTLSPLWLYGNKKVVGGSSRLQANSLSLTMTQGIEQNIHSKIFPTVKGYKIEIEKVQGREFYRWAFIGIGDRILISGELFLAECG